MTIDVRELASRLEELLSMAAAGTEIIVTRDSVPVVRLSPLARRPERIPGLHPGAMQPTEDFDAPLPEEFWTGTP